MDECNRKTTSSSSSDRQEISQIHHVVRSTGTNRMSYRQYFTFDGQINGLALSALAVQCVGHQARELLNTVIGSHSTDVQLSRTGYHGIAAG